MRNKSGATPLLRTVSYTKVATARALLEFGVDSSVKDTSGKSYWDRVLEDAEWSPSARDFLALLVRYDQRLLHAFFTVACHCPG
eukprot:m.157647 g.157647  ORF g.157647 m.157647 type:complete len:84 (-) comp10232_c0_seq8:311-562(-)